MKKSRFSEEQIIGVLKEHAAGIGVAELCRKHGISDATFYTWRKRYGGMEISDARRLKTLEDENARLKKLLAEQMLASLSLPWRWAASSIRTRSAAVVKRTFMARCVAR
ncbi:hypothetical protein ATO13_21161 [Stappia sp. 22II-S9-Z10]|nr:hypothetical protein ATO13_21161 [Stappia sp. 22II-S9-Z10]